MAGLTQGSILPTVSGIAPMSRMMAVASPGDPRACTAGLASGIGGSRRCRLVLN